MQPCRSGAYTRPTTVDQSHWQWRSEGQATGRSGQVRTLPSGRHQALVRDPLTNKQESLGTFPSKAAADRAIREADARRSRGEWVSPQQSRTRFATYATEWLADKKATKRPNTYKGYEKDVRLYL